MSNIEVKKCTRCDKCLTIDNYSFKIKKKGILKPHCKSCDVLIRKNWYITNKSRIIKKVLIRNKDIKIRNNKFIFDYLLENPCIDCGEKNPIVLEFDHRDRISKVSSISKMASCGESIDNIKREISKCDVRCCNCHRIRTSKQFNWFKYINY